MTTIAEASRRMTSRDFRKPSRALRLLQRAGALNRRNLFWSWYEPRNFGDWIGPWLFQRINGADPLFCGPNLGARAEMVFAVGSILRHVGTDDVATVWGSGILSRGDRFARPKRILAVRGPETRARCLALGYDCPEIFGDPAILLPRFFKPVGRRSGTVAVIPHYLERAAVEARFSGLDGVTVVDVAGTVEETVAAITSCDAAVSSSLHGLIVANSYEIPCAWVSFTGAPPGDDVKFRDYYRAGGVEAEVRPTPLCPDAGAPSADALAALAIAAPRPDPTPLAQPLLDVCPFRP